jgi:hypothetical protein
MTNANATHEFSQITIDRLSRWGAKVSGRTSLTSCRVYRVDFSNGDVLILNRKGVLDVSKYGIAKWIDHVS